jgi:hypothetical protein
LDLQASEPCLQSALAVAGVKPQDTPVSRGATSAASCTFCLTGAPRLEGAILGLAGSTPDLPAPRVATELEPRREFPFASPAVFLRWPPSFQPVPHGNLIGAMSVE